MNTATQATQAANTAKFQSDEWYTLTEKLVQEVEKVEFTLPASAINFQNLNESLLSQELGTLINQKLYVFDMATTWGYKLEGDILNISFQSIHDAMGGQASFKLV